LTVVGAVRQPRDGVAQAACSVSVIQLTKRREGRPFGQPAEISPQISERVLHGPRPCAYVFANTSDGIAPCKCREGDGQKDQFFHARALGLLV
jgi:hypothetical protein